MVNLDDDKNKEKEDIDEQTINVVLFKLLVFHHFFNQFYIFNNIIRIKLMIY